MLPSWRAGIKARRPPKLENIWDGPEGPPPDPTRNFYEDRQVGEIYELGSHTFTKDEIIDFARQFDPQPFHLDEAAGQGVAVRRTVRVGLAYGGDLDPPFRRLPAADRAADPRSGNVVARYGPSPDFATCGG